MATLVIVRHGQSAWNLENRFTGDVDVALTPVGEKEAQAAGVLLHKFYFQAAFTSVLKRAILTLEIILKENAYPKPPVIFNAALNERRYGDLQGLNKNEIAKQYGAEQVLIWRRSFDVRPPGGESLKDTYERVIPFYKNNIEPLLRKNEAVLIVAHGNSLRALMMFLESISDTAISDVNLPTGKPRKYEFDGEMKLLKCDYVS